MNSMVPIHKRIVEQKSYIEKGRLQDVLTLITVLAVDTWLYRNEDALMGRIRKKPISADSWTDLALQHPEFFTPDMNESVALLLRAVLPEILVNGEKTRNPLDIAQTQSLMDTAISLHDKAISRRQRNWTLSVPITVAIIAVIGTVGNSYYMSLANKYNLQPIRDSLQSIKVMIQNKH